MVINQIKRLELAHLERRAVKVERDWGYIFYDDTNPNYYESNHAHVLEIVTNPEKVVEEVIDFFQHKQITPRFYIYRLPEQKELVAVLIERDFELERFNDAVQRWNHSLLKLESISDIEIEIVDWNNFDDALRVQGSIEEFGGEEVSGKVFTRDFNDPMYLQFLLRYRGQPAAVASLFIAQQQGLLENLATLEKFRGKSLIGRLIYYIQDYSRKYKLKDLWMIPINQRVEAVYQKYGFETIGYLEVGHAFLNVKEFEKVK